eukprot:TRINITY_DN2098_c0_g1_i1.p1 TRINITY_DN2098_c0_g1~~TRINITY_DN2098_c0_g1_i1.p1  ORF type:complete len:326 (+),score=18.53 TRINITY_DN2098_c0_g1_i1:605-1582(+)
MEIIDNYVEWCYFFIFNSGFVLGHIIVMALQLFFDYQDFPYKSFTVLLSVLFFNSFVIFSVIRKLDRWWSNFSGFLFGLFTWLLFPVFENLFDIRINEGLVELHEYTIIYLNGFTSELDIHISFEVFFFIFESFLIIIVLCLTTIGHTIIIRKSKSFRNMSKGEVRTSVFVSLYLGIILPLIILFLWNTTIVNILHTYVLDWQIINVLRRSLIVFYAAIELWLVRHRIEYTLLVVGMQYCNLVLTGKFKRKGDMILGYLALLIQQTFPTALQYVYIPFTLLWLLSQNNWYSDFLIIILLCTTSILDISNIVANSKIVGAAKKKIL